MVPSSSTDRMTGAITGAVIRSAVRSRDGERVAGVSHAVAVPSARRIGYRAAAFARACSWRYRTDTRLTGTSSGAMPSGFLYSNGASRPPK